MCECEHAAELSPKCLKVLKLGSSADFLQPPASRDPQDPPAEPSAGKYTHILIFPHFWTVFSIQTSKSATAELETGAICCFWVVEQFVHCNFSKKKKRERRKNGLTLTVLEPVCIRANTPPARTGNRVFNVIKR